MMHETSILPLLKLVSFVARFEGFALLPRSCTKQHQMPTCEACSLSDATKLPRIDIRVVLIQVFLPLDTRNTLRVEYPRACTLLRRDIPHAQFTFRITAASSEPCRKNPRATLLPVACSTRGFTSGMKTSPVTNCENTGITASSYQIERLGGTTAWALPRTAS